MKKPIAIILSIMFIPILLSANPGRVKIAVFDFEAGSGISANDAKTFTSLLHSEIMKIDTFEVITRGDKDYDQFVQHETVNEDQGRIKDMTEDELQKIGKMSKIDYIVTGEIRKFDSTLILIVYVTDIQNGKRVSENIKTSRAHILNDLSGLAKKIETMAKKRILNIDTTEPDTTHKPDITIVKTNTVRHTDPKTAKKPKYKFALTISPINTALAISDGHADANIYGELALSKMFTITFGGGFYHQNFDREEVAAGNIYTNSTMYPMYFDYYNYASVIYASVGARMYFVGESLSGWWIGMHLKVGYDIGESSTNYYYYDAGNTIEISDTTYPLVFPLAINYDISTGYKFNLGGFIIEPTIGFQIPFTDFNRYAKFLFDLNIGLAF